MKRGSISLFFIIGLLIIIIISLVYLNRKIPGNEDISFSDLDFQSIFDKCAREAIIKSNVVFGFIDDGADYRSSIIKELDYCLAPFFEDIQKKGYNIVMAQKTAALEINDNTLIVKIHYPVTINSDGGTLTFEDFVETFDRVVNVKLTEIKEGDQIFSSDGIIKLKFSGQPEFYDMAGNKYNENLVIVSLSDKLEKNGEALDGNLIYGVLPLQHISTKDIQLCIYADKILPDSDIPDSELRITWWNRNADKWGVLPTKFQDGCLLADINYTTYYGVMKQYVPYVTPSASFGPWDSLPSSTISAPLPGFSIIVSGSSNVIYEQIRQEMGGPWPLVDDPQCAGNVIRSPAYCAAASSGCGGNAIYCLPNTFSLDKKSQNLLFRHEITHSIQFMNDLPMSECPAESPRKEWGAEYYSDTQCYLFALDGMKYTGRQLAEKLMENPSCTEDMLMDAAFCKPGSYAALDSAGCLMAGNGDIAEDDLPQSCVNV